jgi:hypothetical protein
MNEGESETSQISNAVPEALLGLEKDKRYRQSLSSLISRVVSPYLNTSPTNTTSTDSARRPGQIEGLKPEINVLVRIIHAVVLAKEGTSLGLEYVGLRYHQKKSFRLRIFVVIYVLFPYISDRASRAGWKDLMKIKVSFPMLMKKCSPALVEREQTRGEDRRRLFEESRQRMLNRARIAEESSTNDKVIQAQGDSASIALETVQHRRGFRTQRLLASFRKKMCALVLKALEQIDAAKESRFPTPHGSSNYDSDANDSNSSGNPRSLGRLGGLFKWLIRLNLALFYVNGKYPSILHRLTGLRISNGNQNLKVNAGNVEYNAIGLMVIGQSLAKLVQALAEISLNQFYARKKRILETQNASSLTNHLDAAVPSIEQSQNTITAFSDVNCGICMLPRKHSAAPVSCGHVFCWHCLHNWVATVRAECPLCRAPSRQQEIIALQNYSPY